MDTVPTNSALENALNDKGFAALAQQLAAAFLESEATGGKLKQELEKAGHANSPYATLMTEYFLRMSQLLVKNLESSGKNSHVEARISFTRQLWQLCVAKAAKTMHATNLVHAQWTNASSNQSALDAQAEAIKRGVEIQRIYIINQKVPQFVIDQLRNLVHQQLSIGVQIGIANRGSADTSMDVMSIGTKDFIIFDDQIVYATHIDEHPIKPAPNTVKIHGSQKILQVAKNGWETILGYTDMLQHSTVHQELDPFGGRKSLDD